VRGTFSDPLAVGCRSCPECGSEIRVGTGYSPDLELLAAMGLSPEDLAAYKARNEFRCLNRDCELLGSIWKAERAAA
jgi:hypothetical protein